MSSPKDIVIDADIMRAASTSEHPHASNAKRALDAIRSRKHRMVWCAPLLAEYKKHESRYSATWRANMVSRKLHLFWNHGEDKALRKTLVDALTDGAVAQEKAVLKDAHLLEAAAGTGRRVISKDSTARSLFREACPNLGSYKTILWGDLSGMPDDVVEWIQQDCADENDFRLCPAEEKKRRKK